MKMRTSAFVSVVLLAGGAFASVAPFGVDLYVKSPDFGYYLLRGTRTPSHSYPEAGWSLGLMKSGEIVFNIGDGKNHSYVREKVIRTSWRDGWWNHLACTFDGKDLKLWVNGRQTGERCSHRAYGAKTNACFVTSIESPRALITNGFDPMTGGRFTGEVRDFVFHQRTLTDEDVAVRQAGLAMLRESDAVATKLVDDSVGIDVTPPVTVKPVPLTVFPSPQSMALSAENVVLPEPLVLVAPGGDVRMEKAAKVAVDMFKKSCGATLVRAKSPSEKGTTVVLTFDASLHKEEYRLEGAVRDGAYRLQIDAGAAALVYAVDTLRQILRQRSLENRRQLSLPVSVSIRDWPLMSARIGLWDWANAREDRFPFFCFSRLNGLAISLLDKPGCTEEALSSCCATASAYGLGIVSGFGYNPQGRRDPVTFSKPETVAWMKDWMRFLGRSGVTGLHIMFDDLSGASAEAWLKDPEMRRRFRSEGAFHNAIIKTALAVVEEYPNLTNLCTVVCPTFYMRGAEDRARNYYPDFTAGFRERNIMMEHCVFEPEAVARLKADGAETYAYYINGFWGYRFFTWIAAQESYRWSWYTWYMDLNGIGAVVKPESMAGIRSLHRQTQVCGVADNMPYAAIQTGGLCWNPPAYDPVLADRATAQSIYGSGVYEPFQEYEEALKPIIAYLGAYRTPSTGESGVVVVPRRIGLSNKELAGYRRNLTAAKDAASRVREAIVAQKSPFDLPDLRDQRQRILDGMEKALSAIEKKLED